MVDEVTAALGTLPRYGIQVTAGVPLAGGRLVDLVVEYRRTRVPVEIKDFRAWQPSSAPALKALQQVSRDQFDLSAARGVLWLPRARASLISRWRGPRVGTVLIAFGGARSLARTVRRGLR